MVYETHIDVVQYTGGLVAAQLLKTTTMSMTASRWVPLKKYGVTIARGEKGIRSEDGFKLKSGPFVPLRNAKCM